MSLRAFILLLMCFPSHSHSLFIHPPPTAKLLGMICNFMPHLCLAAVIPVSSRQSRFPISPLINQKFFLIGFFRLFCRAAIVEKRCKGFIFLHCVALSFIFSTREKVQRLTGMSLSLQVGHWISWLSIQELLRHFTQIHNFMVKNTPTIQYLVIMNVFTIPCVDPSGRCWATTKDKWPADCAGWKTRGSSSSVRFILWGTWTSVWSLIL